MSKESKSKVCADSPEKESISKKDKLCAHQFAISAWEFNSKMQWATHVVCQLCKEVSELGYDPRDKKYQNISS